MAARAAGRKRPTVEERRGQRLERCPERTEEACGEEEAGRGWRRRPERRARAVEPSDEEARTHAPLGELWLTMRDDADAEKAGSGGFGRRRCRQPDTGAGARESRRPCRTRRRGGPSSPPKAEQREGIPSATIWFSCICTKQVTRWCGWWRETWRSAYLRGSASSARRAQSSSPLLHWRGLTWEQRRQLGGTRHRSTYHDGRASKGEGLYRRQFDANLFATVESQSGHLVLLVIAHSGALDEVLRCVDITWNC